MAPSIDTERRCLSPRDDLRLLELDDGSLLYDMSGRKIYSLNNWATVAWLICDGQRSADEIADAVAPQDQERRASILEVLETLRREGLVREVPGSHAVHHSL